MSAASTDVTTLSPLSGLGHLLPRLARKWGDKVALVTDSRSLTFTELDSESTRVALGLRERGVKAGDRVSMYSQNRWEWIVAYHGILKAGAVVNPLNVMLTPAEVRFITEDAGTRVLFASGERLRTLNEALPDMGTVDLVVSFDGPTSEHELFTDWLAVGDDPEFQPVAVDPDSLACIAYTSGTTGRPKGAMQSQLSLVLNCAYTAAMHGRREDDVVLTALPAPHVYGNVVVNSTLMTGGRVVLMTRFDAGDALSGIEEHQATLFEGVPAMYALMLAHPHVKQVNLRSLRRSTVGGQTIANSVIDAWERLTGATLLELWGMTELSGVATTHALHAPNVRGSIGVALPGTEVRVVRPDGSGEECSPGEPGELVVRGPLVTMGYFNNPAATAEVMTADGGLCTGDIATHDGTGHFFVVDRLKDMIITGGYNVYPAEIERVLIGHESVALVGVGRHSDEVKGEVAHAYVVLAPGAAADEDALLSFARRHLAAYKVPRAVHFVDSLPMTSSGKVMRRELGNRG